MSSGPSVRGPGRAAGRARPTGPDPRARARGLDLHQRDEAVDLGLPRRQLGQDAAEAQRVLAQRRPHPVVAGGGRVALVEDQVDDLEHRGQAGRELVAARNLEGHPRLGQRPLGPHDPLGHGRLRDQERARDLLGRQPAEQPQGERDARLGGQHRVAGGEHQAQQVVADVVGRRGLEVGRGHLLPGLHLAAELLLLALAAARSRRKRSIARCFAVAMSQAPGLSGTPDSGHRSSAATSASCARSSARPTSPTIRASPAISLADSIRQTASIARCASEAVTSPAGCLVLIGDLRPHALLGRPRLGRELVAEVLRLEHLAHLDLGRPRRTGARFIHSIASSLDLA